MTARFPRTPLAAWLPFDTAAIVAHRQAYPRAAVKGVNASAVWGGGAFRDYPSILNRIRFPCRDHLLRAAMVMHDVDPCTAAFRPNHRTLVVRTAGARWLHRPELRVTFTSGTKAFVSLRPAAEPELFGRLLPAIDDACRRSGAMHMVLDEQVAVDSIYGRNCRTVRWAGETLDDDMVIAAATVLDRVALPARVGDLIEAAAGGRGDVAVIGLAAFRIVALPLATPIGSWTIVRRGANW